MFADSVRGKKNAIIAMALAYGFRLTGRLVFIKMFHKRRNLLLWRSELAAIASRLRADPGTLLVFGARNDSIFWHVLNKPRRTIFVEDDPAWRDLVRNEWRSLGIELVTYVTRVSELVRQEKDEEAEENAVPPSLDLSAAARARKWDTIIVDAPQGWGDGPGRLQSIHEASRLIDASGRIFVHDCDRAGERQLVGRYLGQLRCTPVTERLWMFERAAQA